MRISDWSSDVCSSDLTAGAVVLRRGQKLRPQDVGQAAAVGRQEVVVTTRLKVGLFSTGDELREPGMTLDAGAIYDSNRYTIHALLTGLGCHVEDLGILPDRDRKSKRMNSSH